MVITVERFNERLREDAERRARAAAAHRRLLTAGDQHVWRCRGCGAWRYAFNLHICPRPTDETLAPGRLLVLAGAA